MGDNPLRIENPPYLEQHSKPLAVIRRSFTVFTGRQETKFFDNKPYQGVSFYPVTRLKASSLSMCTSNQLHPARLEADPNSQHS